MLVGSNGRPVGRPAISAKPGSLALVDNFFDFAPRAATGAGGALAPVAGGAGGALAPLGSRRPPLAGPGNRAAKAKRNQVQPVGAGPKGNNANTQVEAVGMGGKKPKKGDAPKEGITHKFITERKAGWTFSDMLRDRKEVENLQALRAELLLESEERRRLERSTLCECYTAWALLGIVHGGHWLVLASKANDPRLRYLAKTNIRALRGSLKKVETLIRTLEQHHDSVSPDACAHQDAVDEDERRRRLVIAGAAGLQKPAKLGPKMDPYVVVRLDGEWIGQTQPVFDTDRPKVRATRLVHSSTRPLVCSFARPLVCSFARPPVCSFARLPDCPVARLRGTKSACGCIIASSDSQTVSALSHGA